MRKSRAVPYAIPEAAMGMNGVWLVLSLAISSSHQHCMVNVLIMAEFTRGHKWSRRLIINFCPGGS